MSQLHPCPTCRRHVRGRCPRCGILAKVTTLVLATSVASTLAACYGGPPPRPNEPQPPAPTGSTTSSATPAP